MSQELRSTLSDKTVDDAISSIDAISKTCSEEISLGPFGVFGVEGKDQPSETQHQSSSHEVGAEESRPETQGTINEAETAAPPEFQSFLDLDLWPSTDNLLDWPDIFDLNSTPSWLPFDAFPDLGIPRAEEPSTIVTIHDENDENGGRLPLPSLASEQEDNSRSKSRELEFADLLSTDQAQLLLKHFSESMVAHVWSFPLGQKSSMDIHVDAAVTTLARLTFMKARPVSAASISHFYALLAHSAMHMASERESGDVEHWQNLAELLVKEAKQNFQRSLEREILPKKAKYKDLVMAVSSILCFAVSIGY